MEIYRQRVHSAYNILHWPPILKQIEEAYSKPQSVAKSILALESSICFMAVFTFTDGESVQMGFWDNTDAKEQYLVATQDALSKFNLILSPSLITL
jgi:hypothetical protein